MRYILTFDYELFGSGKGSIRKHLVDPTNKLLDLINRRNLKATFFVEQLELKAILDQANAMDACKESIENARLMRDQILRIVRDGHDIQLHLHPQWYKAQFVNGNWKLNFDWWRFSDLPYHSKADGTPGRYDLIRDGKKYLEDLIRTIRPDYQCLAFRAGGYNIGVDSASYKALVDNNIVIDSSICPGFFNSGPLSRYDYTEIDSNMHFPFLSSVDPNKPLIEYPVTTINSPILERISLARIYSTLMNRKYKIIRYSESREHRDIWDPTHAGRLKNSNFDVCLSSHSQIKKFLDSLSLQKVKYSVLIGHPKDYSCFSPLKRIINIIEGKTITFSKICEGV